MHTHKHAHTQTHTLTDTGTNKHAHPHMHTHTYANTPRSHAHTRTTRLYHTYLRTCTVTTYAAVHTHGGTRLRIILSLTCNPTTN